MNNTSMAKPPAAAIETRADSPTSVIDSSCGHPVIDFTYRIAAVGLYVAIASASVAELRLTHRGVARVGEGASSPFLYEVGLGCLILAALIGFFRGGLVWSIWRVRLAGVICLFYTPIFLNAYLYSPDLRNLFIGSGQLRLQLELWLFSLAVLCFRLRKETIRNALIVAVGGCVINVTYALLVSVGLAENLYPLAYREYGEFRISGLLRWPGELGAMCAIVFAIVALARIHYMIKIAIGCMCILGIILADSRTGMAFLVLFPVLVAARALPFGYYFRVMASLIALAFAIAWVGLSLDAVVAIDEGGRLEMVKASLEVVGERPFGIPWGNFGVYSTRPPPHNVLLLAFVYGGFASFIAALLFPIWLGARWLDNSGGVFVQVALGGMLAVFVTALFEQVVQQPYSMMIFFLCLSISVMKLDEVRPLSDGA